MVTPVLSSTAFLTVLLTVGLFFFIRASTKDRIQVARLISDEPENSLLEALETYFTSRAYRLAKVDTTNNQITFEGLVSASVFLAAFLTLLAAVGLLCIALVLAFLFPEPAPYFPLLVALSPLAGFFYWQKSTRQEQVLLRIESVTNDQQTTQRLLTVTAHRDELAELQRNLKLNAVEADEL